MTCRERILSNDYADILGDVILTGDYEYDLPFDYCFHQITQDKTVIFISHRLSSTRFCDKVLLFSDGSILAEGTHKELMESNCHYKELYMMQAKYYTDSE